MYYWMSEALLGLVAVLFLWAPFQAALLWTFGVHMAKQKEERYVSYLGVSCLCAFIAVLYCSFMGWISMEILRDSSDDPRGMIFGFTFVFFILQSFFSILFGHLIWKGTWLQSFLTWLFLLIVFFVINLILWINMFSY
tara:strand:- start:145 stop:558 length:414 start_codon:yes stop_codon:yes gene_type:complete